MNIAHSSLPVNLQDQYTIKLFARSYSLSTRTALLLIISVAVLLRLAAALYLGNTVTDLPGINDQISYDGLAQRVVGGHGFSYAEGHWPATRGGEPTAHWSFLYTLYLAGIYKLFGYYPLIARILQALIAGVLQPILIWRIGTRLFNRRVGLIAAALFAVYIYFFYYAGALMTETFYITGILWTLDVSLRIVAAYRMPASERKKGYWRQWLELGLALGITVLFRQVILPFLPILFIWLWWNVRNPESSTWQKVLHWSAVKGLLGVGLILVLMIAPWTIRNYRAFGTFVLLNTNAGFAFYWGNHPIYGIKFVPLLDTKYQDLIPPNLLPLNEGKLDQALLREGIKIVLDDPVRYVLLSISRIEEYIKFWPSKDSGLISNISRVGSFGILLPFMLVGLWLSTSHYRKPIYTGQRSDLLIFYLFMVAYTGIHLMTWTLIRYRLPVDAVLIIFSALSFEALFKRSNRVLMVDSL